MGFARALASSTRYETQGLGTGVGTTITASATANAKGSFATLGTTSFAYDGFYVAITGLSGGGGARFRVDVSANTGSADEVIAGDLYFDPSIAGSYYVSQRHILVPVKVPKGAVLKARCQATTGSVTCSASILGFAGDPRQAGGFRGMFTATDWTNTDPTNSITLSGTTLTGWTQIQATTAQRFAALYASFDSIGSGSLSIVHATIELGQGSSGSETTLGIVIPFQINSAGGINGWGPFPCDIPAGSRLVARARCDATDTNVIAVVLNGLAA